jgi:hypothetical protein
MPYGGERVMVDGVVMLPVHCPQLSFRTIIVSLSTVGRARWRGSVLGELGIAFTCPAGADSSREDQPNVRPCIVKFAVNDVILLTYLMCGN